MGTIHDIQQGFSAAQVKRIFTTRQEAILDGIRYALAEGGCVEIHRDVPGNHMTETI